MLGIEPGGGARREARWRFGGIVTERRRRLVVIGVSGATYARKERGVGCRGYEGAGAGRKGVPGSGGGGPQKGSG